jgi:hypothetical protein
MAVDPDHNQPAGSALASFMRCGSKYGYLVARGAIGPQIAEAPAIGDDEAARGPFDHGAHRSPERPRTKPVGA